jgi:hypothetical protein
MVILKISEVASNIHTLVLDLAGCYPVCRYKFPRYKGDLLRVTHSVCCFIEKVGLSRCFWGGEGECLQVTGSQGGRFRAVSWHRGCKCFPITQATPTLVSVLKTLSQSVSAHTCNVLRCEWANSCEELAALLPLLSPSTIPWIAVLLYEVWYAYLGNWISLQFVGMFPFRCPTEILLFSLSTLTLH